MGSWYKNMAYRLKVEVCGRILLSEWSETMQDTVMEMRLMVELMSRKFGMQYGLKGDMLERLHQILTDDTGALQKQLVEAIEWWKADRP